MIKGVNKQIIEINEMDNKIFEKAVLYVRPEYAEISESKLNNSAKQFVKDMSGWDLLRIAPLQSDKKQSKKANKKIIVTSLLVTTLIIAGVIFTLLTVL